MKQTLVLFTISIFCSISLTTAVPRPQNDNDELNFDILQNSNVDYNTMMAHFKEFFAYLPVVFSTFKDTMSGFPKLAEGIRILTSSNYESTNDGDDCKCKPKEVQNSNEINKSAANIYR